MNRYLKLMRVHQWFKNGLVFVPLIFSGNVTTTSLYAPVLWTFLGFCLLASGTYVLNDLLDVKRDRLHPTKQHRPIASGAVSSREAIGLGAILLLAGFAAFYLVNVATIFFGAIYLALQVAYNGFLKHVAIWDAITVSLGLVLRAIAGTVAIRVGEPTVWLLICTFLFALYLSFSKRRSELHKLAEEAKHHRPSLHGYSKVFLDQALIVSTGLILATYTLYTVFGTSPWMIATLPFAFFGILRYNLLLDRGTIEDEAEAIFRDRQTLWNAAAWLLITILALGGQLETILEPIMEQAA